MTFASSQISRRLALLLCGVVPLAFGFLALALGQDGNWDLRNYHWYNPYAFLHDRWVFDLGPSTFYNPLIDLPAFLAAQVLPAKAVSFLLGTVQGLNYILLFALARALLRDPPEPGRSAAAGVIALVGMVGGGHLGLVGATFNDNIVSLAIIGAALVIAAAPEIISHGPVRAAFVRAAVAGLIMGAGVGLKLPTAVFAVGFCLAFLFVSGSPWRRLFLAFFFGVGVLTGLAVFAGHWMWMLWRDFGNPLFPYFNAFFQSPLGLAASYRDTRFVPGDVVTAIFFPFVFSFDLTRVGEIVFRDFRIAAAYLAWLATPIMLLARRAAPVMPMVEPTMARYLAIAAGITLFVWMPLFGIYRYIIPLEMLAPLLIVAAVALWPMARRARIITTGIILLLLTVSAMPGTWGRAPWAERFVDVRPPPIADNSLVVMTGFTPMSFVIPAFPPRIPFLRLQGYFNSPDDGDTGFNRALKDRLARHAGDIYLLYAVPERDVAEKVLPKYRLMPDFNRCAAVLTNLAADLQLCAVSREP